MKSILWVAAGGACGAVLRFAVQEIANTSNSFPWGTFVVNATGSFAVGLLVGLFAGTPWFEGVGRTLLVAGLLGGFTTFSAFSAETVLLLEQGRLGSAAVYVAASVVVCLAAALGGYRLAGALQ
ncbi:MAG: fluoride efflux transporter CrcB [Gammaproteobacteria bacterium]|nr:fluoride efflux transporter CrcB [Gammaproteobacteria bacterium]